jgi:hypothetical protein
MKKFFIVCIFFLTIILFIPDNFAYSTNNSSNLVPGVDCGNAEGTSNAKKCCTKSTTLPDISSAFDRLTSIPIVGGMIGGSIDFLRTSALQLEKSNNIIPCPIGYPSKINDPNCECLLSSQVTPSPVESIKKMCSDYFTTPKEAKERQKCDDCANRGGVWIGLGLCVEGNIGNFIQQVVFGRLIGLAGIIVLFCIIYSAFQLQTSQGNPEKIKKAQEALSSCVTGLILIILSVFILKIIGVDILKIPGFK